MHFSDLEFCKQGRLGFAHQGVSLGCCQRNPQATWDKSDLVKTLNPKWLCNLSNLPHLTQSLIPAPPHLPAALLSLINSSEVLSIPRGGKVHHKNASLEAFSSIEDLMYPVKVGFILRRRKSQTGKVCACTRRDGISSCDVPQGAVNPSPAPGRQDVLYFTLCQNLI